MSRCICLERISPVTFHITDCILEHIGRAIDGKHPIHRVMYTENAVPALHEGKIPERPHNVIPDWCEWPKPKRAGGMEVGCLDVKRDALFPKAIPGNADLIGFPVKIRAGVWNMEGLRGYQLYGTEFGLSGSVDGRYNGECLLF